MLISENNKTYKQQIMDNDDGEFYVEPEEEEVREIQQIEEPNPIYMKPVSEEPRNVTLKMIEIPKPEPNFYQPFKITFNKSESEDEEDAGQFMFNSPFTQYYSKEQLVYQKFDNSACNRIKGVTYFSGAFLQKNIFPDYAKYSEQATSLKHIVAEYFDVDNDSLPQPQSDDLIFDSDFESGNLFAAFKISNREYDLVMQNDVNSYGNNQWFYFSVEKMVCGAQYTFNVVNFTKNDSLFNYGMGVAMYSTMEHKKNGIEWHRGGKDVCYKRGRIPRENSRRFYYKLSFKLTNKHHNDKIFLAHSYPYTYEKLNKHLDSICLKNQQIVSRVVIGKTLAKKNIEALMICQKNPNNKRKDTRKVIIVMARQHPGETQGSFVCDGVIDKLIQKGCKEGEFLRKNFVIYVIPMVNPDGVIYGHYRTNLSGRDLNRKWDSTEKQMNVPEVTSIKSFLLELSKQRDIRFIIDLHGHSKKLNSFFYGNPCPDNPELVRIFPFLCSKLNQAVQYMDCTFASEEYKRKAARVYLSYYYKQIQVYTFESSFYAYFKDGKKQEFTPKEYLNLGGTLIQALQLVLENDIRNGGALEVRPKDTSIFAKYLNELKTNPNLLQVGLNQESGSDSKPEEGEVNVEDIPTEVKEKKVATTTPVAIEERKKSAKRTTSRKGHREYKEIRQISKPVRNIKFLEISRVNSVLPDRYQLGLQPIRKKQSAEPIISRNQSQQIIKISSYCQTDAKQLPLDEYKNKDIEDFKNLSNSIKLGNQSEKKYTSVIKNTSRNNNIIFKIDILNERSSSTLNIRNKKRFLNAFTQTMVSFPCNRSALSPQRSERIRSSQLFPLVDTPESDRRAMIKTNPIKYETKKLGMKKEAEIFLNGMVKKYLVDKEMKMKEIKDGATRVIERPLSIKKKEIYHK